MIHSVFSCELKASVTVQEGDCIFDFTLICKETSYQNIPPFWLLRKSRGIQGKGVQSTRRYFYQLEPMLLSLQTRLEMTQEKKDFMKIDGDAVFQNRAKSIFEGLDGLEPQKETESSSPRERTAGKRRRPHQVPDHVLHPEKWTKYSLEEDGSEHLERLNPNEVNRQAAFSFLNELKDRRKSASKDENGANKDSSSIENKSEKHSFTKASERSTDSYSEERDSQGSSKQGVNVMPEYVVGQTKHQNKRKRVETGKPAFSSNQQVGTEVQINHLLQAEQESDETDQVESNTEAQKSEKVVFVKRKHSRNIRKHQSDDD